MKRLHLFELEDMQWFPKPVREGMVDFLRFMIIKTQYYDPAIPLINELIDKTGSDTIIDLCSGGGGGITELEKMVNKGRSEPVKFIMTDLYPNLKAFRYIKNHHPNIDYMEHSVNATNVDPALQGIRSLFASFHHFKPLQAKRILQDAADKKIPLIIIDGARKNMLLKFWFMLIVPFVVLITTPFIRPFRFNRLFYTYLIPLIPLGVLWDGLVSSLRFYSEKEIRNLIDQTDHKGYHFKTGILKGKTDHIGYIIGFEDDKRDPTVTGP